MGGHIVALRHDLANYPRMFARYMLDWRSVVSRPAGAADEMGRLAAKYSPHFDLLPDAHAERLLHVSNRAVENLEVGLVSSRYPSRGLTDAIEHGSYLPTMFTRDQRILAKNAVILEHHVSQRTRNFMGVGDDKGRTMFTTLCFARPSEGGGVVEALAGHRGIQTATFGGPVALDLLPIGPGGIDPARLSVTARDSTFAFALPAPWSRLGDTVAERVARDFGFVRDFVKVGPEEYRAAAYAELVAVRNERLLSILAGSEDDAVRAIEDHITSPRMSELNQYMEAQVRGGCGSDVARVRIVGDIRMEAYDRVFLAAHRRGIDLLDQRIAGAMLDA
jgi:hypothetical protein